MVKVLLVMTLNKCVLGILEFAANGFGLWLYGLYHGQAEYIEPFAGRITSVFLHVNPFAAFLNLVLPLALAVRVQSPEPSAARLGGLCFFTGMLTLFLTESRGALLAFALMLGLAFRYLVKDRGSRRKILLQV